MVRNIIGFSGNAVANQFVIRNSKGVYFQSYNSVVCRIDRNGVTLGCDWDYSNTTRKYLYKFLRDNGYDVYSIKDVRERIKNKEFKYKANLAM